MAKLKWEVVAPDGQKKSGIVDFFLSLFDVVFITPKAGATIYTTQAGVLPLAAVATVPDATFTVFDKDENPLSTKADATGYAEIKNIPVA